MNFMCTISVFPLLSIGANLVEKKKITKWLPHIKSHPLFPWFSDFNGN